MRIRAGVLVIVFSLLSPGSGRAQEDAAWPLLDEVRKLNQTTRAWKDRRQELRVTIVDRRDNERRREMEVFTKKQNHDASRSILFFLSPPEVRGIGLLQWIEPHEEDRNWLYLPELKRVRQITGSSRRESFVGTDFSYEDLAVIQEILDWTREDTHASLVAEEAIDGHSCAVIEMMPHESADVSYGKIRLWLGRDDQVVHKYAFEDQKGRVAKTLLVSDIRMVEQIPAAYRLEMRNERGGSHTVIEFTKILFDTGLPDDMFSQRRLEQGV